MTAGEYPGPMLTFEVTWYAGYGLRAGERPDVVGTEEVRRRCLSDAVVYACNALKSNRGVAGSAHGFNVRFMREHEHAS